jgi:hypothetical protein
MSALRINQSFMRGYPDEVRAALRRRVKVSGTASNPRGRAAGSAPAAQSQNAATRGTEAAMATRA